jgi:transcriptional regulator with XRE-family HTH domain
MRNDMLEIATRLRALIKEHGANSSDLARALDLSAEELSRLLSGHRGLAAGELAILCNYGVSRDIILFGRTDEVAAPNGGSRVLARVQRAFADYRYLRALVGP